MEKSTLEQILKIYDALTPENQNRFLEIVEATVHNQEASLGSLKSVSEENQ